MFLALPHGAAQGIVPELRKKVGAIVDLSADFRLTDPDLYPQWYHEPHQCPELLPEFVYGLPELYRDAIIGSTAVAVPGCYPTAASLALAPLVREGVIEPSGIIVDAASGVSGAGVGLKENTAFCTVDEDFVAYGLLDHRHTPEMEQVIGASVLFTPHLAPMNRGILATCYARPVVGHDADDRVAARGARHGRTPTSRSSSCGPRRRRRRRRSAATACTSPLASTSGRVGSS